MSQFEIRDVTRKSVDVNYSIEFTIEIITCVNLVMRYSFYVVQSIFKVTVKIVID